MTPVDPLALLPAAFIAGLLMFLAPCTLPIVPGYLAFIAGTPEGSLRRSSARRRVFFNALAFVAGFSLVFILLGVFAAALGALVGPWRDALSRAAGIIIILFGLTLLGVVRVPVLSQEKRLHIPHLLTIGRPESSLLIGMLFALGWSPCIGPILGSVLLFASASATAAQGALLLGVFSLGLGLPFIATALLLERAGAAFARWGVAARWLSVAGGVVLIALGFLMLAGQMSLLVNLGFGAFGGYRALLNYM